MSNNAPERTGPSPEEAQQLTTDLLALPPEVLAHIAQYVPRLQAMAHAHPALAQAATTADDGRWRAYFQSLTDDLDPGRLDDDLDRTCAWILRAGEYLRLEEAGNVPAELPDSAAALRAGLGRIITQGLNERVAARIGAANLAGGPDAVDAEVTAHFDELMRRYAD